MIKGISQILEFLVGIWASGYAFPTFNHLFHDDFQGLPWLAIGSSGHEAVPVIVVDRPESLAVGFRYRKSVDLFPREE